ncbi:hypothetical protein BKI52_21450 [marine bacterium AO1-C]|nr:hypothetical protein BKI52_21450 [marine bacterium AO1-C]
MKYPLPIFFLVILFASMSQVKAQTKLEGRVLDDQAHPLVRAKVYLKKYPNLYTLTNQYGNFALDVAINPQQFNLTDIVASKRGFEMTGTAQMRGRKLFVKLQKVKNSSTKTPVQADVTSEPSILSISNPKQRTNLIINKLKDGKPLNKLEVMHLANLVNKIDHLTNRILMDKESSSKTIDSLKSEIGALKTSIAGVDPNNHSDSLKQVIQNFEQNLKNKDALIEYRLEKKQKEEERKLELAESKRERDRWQIIGLIALVMVMMVLAAIFYVRSRGRKTLQKTLEEVKESRTQLAERKEQIKQKNEEMAKIQTSKEILTTTIAHDLRNPLNVIMGYSSEETAHCPQETLNSRLAEINLASRRIESYIDDIVAIQKYAYSGLKVEMESNSLYEVAELAVAHMRPFIQQKSLQIQNNFPETLYTLFNFKFIERVFINLLNNAIKFTPTGGRITFTAEERGQVVHVSFADTGEGISKEKFKQLFEPLIEDDAKHFASETSSSLGLVFCKIALEAHGSKIGVESELGKGTTFTFDLEYTHRKPVKSYLPKKIATSELTNSKVNGETPIAAQNGKIELSEEDKTVLRPFVKEMTHYELYEVSDLEEVLARLNTHENANLIKWKQAIQTAIDNYNELQYKELVKSIN